MVTKLIMLSTIIGDRNNIASTQEAVDCGRDLQLGTVEREVFCRKCGVEGIRREIWANAPSRNGDQSSGFF